MKLNVEYLDQITRDVLLSVNPKNRTRPNFKSLSHECLILANYNQKQEFYDALAFSWRTKNESENFL